MKKIVWCVLHIVSKQFCRGGCVDDAKIQFGNGHGADYFLHYATRGRCVRNSSLEDAQLYLNPLNRMDF